MNANEIINQLQQAGVRLWEEGGELRYRAPKGALTEAHRAAIAAHRGALVEALRGPGAMVVPDPAASLQPFPLTDVQSAYLFGRHAGFGGVACHMYVEVALGEADHGALERAWNALIARHPMLRAVIDPDGSQRVLERVPQYRIALCHDGADQVRREMGHALRDPAVWPLFELRLTPTPGNAVLHLSVDFIIADWASIRILQGELEQLRRDPDCALVPLELSFRDYVLAERGIRESARFARDRAYWLERVDQLAAAPQLPMAPEAADAGAAPPRFRRLTLRLSAPQWEALRALAAKHGVTPSSAVLAAYAEVLGGWSRRRSFTLNLTLLNRMPLHPGVGAIVGDFTSVNLLAVDNQAEDGFGARAKAISAQLFDDLDHRLFSGVEVIRELARRRGREAALMPLVFTSAIGMNAGAEGEARHQPQLGWGITQTPQVWIDCQAMDWQGELLVNWDMREGVLADGVADDMFAAFSELLQRLARDDGAWQARAPLALPADQAGRRLAANDTATALPDGLLHEAVFAAALRAPRRRALVSGERALDYAELAGHACSVSAALADAGCRPGALVAIVMDKGWEQVVAVLGVLRAGAAWLPIDTNQPPARRELLLAGAGVSVVLTQSWLAAELAQAGRKVVAVDALTAMAPPTAPPPRLVAPDALAYVIYTSGSSGKPKGVMVSHAAALNTIVDINQRFGVGPDERVFGLANLGFDLSVYDVIGPLSLGACLVLPEAARRADPSHWAELVQRHQLSMWNSVPAQLQMLEHCLAATPQLHLPSLRLALLSGDWIPLTLPPQMRSRLPQLELVSLGGATEAAIWSIYHRIDGAPSRLSSVPYGKPLANQQFYVLGEGGRDCPELVAGELYIGGAGLAIGYLNDPEQTAQRFIDHPLTGARLYRTGDLGRYLRDGSIEFLGREDAQVKIRGNRVELAEVEAALQSHPAVREVAVIVDGDERLNRRLVAFVAPRAGVDGQAAPELDAAQLASHVGLLLPPYMVPGRIEIVAALPLSDNGKVDRRALRNLAADIPALEADAGEMPRNALEKRLEEIWCEVLELPRVGREQDFFRLGGDSLRAARLVGRVRESVPEAAGMFFDSLVRQLLPSPTIAALAAYLESQGASRPPVALAAPAASPLQRLDGGAPGARDAAGAAAPARVLVHDGAGRLAGFHGALDGLLAHPAPLFGLHVNEAASYLHPGPAALLERRVTSYARLLQAHGQRSVQLAGRGFGAMLALELARRLAENGIEIVSLTLLDPRAPAGPLDEGQLDALFALELGELPAWPEVDRIDDQALLRRMFGDSVRASAPRAGSPYLGDITLLYSGTADADATDWGALVLGDVRRIEQVGAPSAALASLLFDATLAAGVWS